MKKSRVTSSDSISLMHQVLRISREISLTSEKVFLCRMGSGISLMLQVLRISRKISLTSEKAFLCRMGSGIVREWNTCGRIFSVPSVARLAVTEREGCMGKTVLAVR